MEKNFLPAILSMIVAVMFAVFAVINFYNGDIFEAIEKIPLVIFFLWDFRKSLKHK